MLYKISTLFLFMTTSNCLAQTAQPSTINYPLQCARVLVPTLQKHYKPLAKSDKFKHCSVACIIQVACSLFDSITVSVAKEIIDIFTPDDADLKDLDADIHGIYYAIKYDIRSSQICENHCNYKYAR